ncbi:isochorismatase domain-containing protein 2 isoform X1 [Eptesicus fuscus]|uniref:isochorismatase domain-containing protein 2 isoform X1 n=1 Tax=Eptesicus fuscus TaxID=29078 RepID=UPI0024043E50|nr:isochorismatase domain-containing protein 2 isoform X1 [Eptesicus fuscus]
MQENGQITHTRLKYLHTQTWRLPSPPWAGSSRGRPSSSCVTCRRSSATSPTSPRSSLWPPACSRLRPLSPLPAQVARLLEVPTVLTEQYPQGLGPTVPELGAAGLQPLAKTCFSMVPVAQQELAARPQLRSVLLCGIETQACILNTALDLLDRGLQVHVVVDACSSRSQVDRLVALARMRQSGAFLSTSEGLILQLVGDAAHPQFKEIQKIIKEPAPDSGLLGLFQGQNPLLR